MQKLDYSEFKKDTGKRKRFRLPLRGSLELTYRCNLNCIHCYCKGSEHKGRELTTARWRYIIDQIRKAGCLWLTFTGGEPFERDDFLELYTYAHKKGFLISIFSNGTHLSDEVIKVLTHTPPFSVEISLYGVTKKVHESVTQVLGSFQITRKTIATLVRLNTPLILKTVGLKQNKREILNIKAFTESILGKEKFKFDSFISPKLNGNTVPGRYRLSPQEILEIEQSNPDMMRQRLDELPHFLAAKKRPPQFLYRCSTWMNSFSINPYGILQFCNLTKFCSVNLTNASFYSGFYKEFPKLLYATFKTNSKCRNCALRDFCLYCPARASLEVKNEEGPVGYYCQMAKVRYRQASRLAH